MARKAIKMVTKDGKLIGFVSPGKTYNMQEVKIKVICKRELIDIFLRSRKHFHKSEDCNYIAFREYCKGHGLLDEQIPGSSRFRSDKSIFKRFMDELEKALEEQRLSLTNSTKTFNFGAMEELLGANKLREEVEGECTIPFPDDSSIIPRDIFRSIRESVTFVERYGGKGKLIIGPIDGSNAIDSAERAKNAMIQFGKIYGNSLYKQVQEAREYKFKIGTRVKHHLFGEGVVDHLNMSGPIVKFDDKEKCPAGNIMCCPEYSLEVIDGDK